MIEVLTAGRGERSALARDGRCAWGDGRKIWDLPEAGRGRKKVGALFGWRYDEQMVVAVTVLFGRSVEDQWMMFFLT